MIDQPQRGDMSAVLESEERYSPSGATLSHTSVAPLGL
jgi:hypothetical protein